MQGDNLNTGRFRSIRRFSVRTCIAFCLCDIRDLAVGAMLTSRSVIGWYFIL